MKERMRGSYEFGKEMKIDVGIQTAHHVGCIYRERGSSGDTGSWDCKWGNELRGRVLPHQRSEDGEGCGVSEDVCRGVAKQESHAYRREEGLSRWAV